MPEKIVNAIFDDQFGSGHKEEQEQYVVFLLEKHSIL